MRRLNWTSLRTFHDAAFIRNVKSFCQIFLTLTYLLSSTLGVRSYYVAPRSRALLSSYRSFTPICTNLYSTSLFITLVRDVCMVVTPAIVAEVLHVPRVAHLDYPSSECLKTVSKDVLVPLFCETPSSWGDCQNTPCSAFDKGLRFLNMVMIFVLHPL